MLSVICPIYNEAKYIEVCLQSILLQDYPKEDLEVLFVDGMSQDLTRQIIVEYSVRYPFIRLVDNPRRIVPVAMNIGIRASKGDVIMRIDAHARYPVNYFSELVKTLYELEADNIGAACQTDVLNKTPKTLAIKEVLSNKFGVGNSTFRLGVNRVIEVDTVPFGCWKREVFDKYGFYNECLIRNQDIEFNKRIVRSGGRIFIIPNTYCVYLARETFKALAIPLLFVLSLILPIVFSFFYFPAVIISLMSLLLYSLSILIISLLLGLKKGLNSWYLMNAFVTLHLSYGWGSLVGVIEVMKHGKYF